MTDQNPIMTAAPAAIPPDYSTWTDNQLAGQLIIDGGTILKLNNDDAAIKAEQAKRALAPASLYFSSSTGNDANDGKSPETPKKIVVLTDGVHHFLFYGDKFPPIAFDGHKNLSVDAYGDASKPKPVIFATTGICTTWSATTANCTLANVKLDSPSQNNGGTLRGTNIVWSNVDFGNLYDGCIIQGAVNPSFLNCNQVGTMQGRCLYFEGATNPTVKGGTMGPSVHQCAIRLSSPAITGGLFQNVTATQAGQWQVAPWSIHAANGTHFDGIVSVGDLSLDTAGEGTGDVVQSCLFTNIAVHGKLNISHAAKNCTFDGGILDNTNGENVAINGNLGGNVVKNMEGNSTKHFAHGYAVPATDIFLDFNTLKTTNTKAPILDGSYVKTNLGTHNHVVPA